MKNRVFLILLSISTALLLHSCSDSLFTDMNRTIEDPVVVEPEVRSFTDELTIQLNWEEDPGADEYVIYRANDLVGNYEMLYRGNDLSYTDKDVTNEDRFLYTMVKMRGEEAFGPSSSVLGVASMTVQDDFESNDEEGNATPFHHNLSANVHCYASEAKTHILEDYDWYSIEVRPQMQAIFRIEVSGVSALDPTGLIFYLKPDIPAEILNQDELVIENHTMERRTFSFCIYPDRAQIITSNNGGGRIIHYELKFIQEQAL